MAEKVPASITSSEEILIISVSDERTRISVPAMKSNLFAEKLRYTFRYNLLSMFSSVRVRVPVRESFVFFPYRPFIERRLMFV